MHKTRWSSDSSRASKFAFLLTSGINTEIVETNTNIFASCLGTCWHNGCHKKVILFSCGILLIRSLFVMSILFMIYNLFMLFRPYIFKNIPYYRTWNNQLTHLSMYYATIDNIISIKKFFFLTPSTVCKNQSL